MYHAEINGRRVSFDKPISQTDVDWFSLTSSIHSYFKGLSDEEVHYEADGLVKTIRDLANIRKPRRRFLFF